MRIYSIVEGHGEVQAVPVLLRRLLDEYGVFNVDVPPAFRRRQSHLLTKEGLQLSVKLAKLQPDCSGIVVLFENEDDCPKSLGPKLSEWAKAVSHPIPCIVALPHREYEAWFLASLNSLKGKRMIRENAISPENPEYFRDAKGVLEECMEEGACYLETTDQAAFSALFNLREAYLNSRSFRHLVKAFGELIGGMGMPIREWPPASWQITEE